MPRPGKKRLTVDIPVLMHEQLEEIAKKWGLTMSDIVKMLVQSYITKMLNE